MGTRYLPDLKRFRLPFVMPAGAPMPRVETRRPFRARFLRGPVPWPWLSCAARLPGRALHVAVAIRLWTGIKKTNCIVLPTSTLQGMGVNRHAASRAVQALEEAGLLKVTRRLGRKSLVCVIEIDEGREREDGLAKDGEK